MLKRSGTFQSLISLLRSWKPIGVCKVCSAGWVICGRQCSGICTLTNRINLATFDDNWLSYMAKVYVASSWRNQYYTEMVQKLRSAVRQWHSGSWMGWHLRAGVTLWPQCPYRGRLACRKRKENHCLYTGNAGGGTDVFALWSRYRQFGGSGFIPQMTLVPLMSA